MIEKVVNGDSKRVTIADVDNKEIIEKILEMWKTALLTKCHKRQNNTENREDYLCYVRLDLRRRKQASHLLVASLSVSLMYVLGLL